MKFIFLFSTLLSLNTLAQTNIEFNKRFVECEDKWVAFSMGEDSSYTYGFIYIDAQAGLTFNREGKFKINSNYLLEVTKNKEASIKVRLQPNNVKVAIIPSTMFKELQIEEYPDWLKFYKNDTATAKRLFNWGFMYNGWDLCAKALTYLERAKQIEPNYEGLNVELAFSYNCLSQYDKAEKILEAEMKNNSSNAYVVKEYIYTLVQNKKIDLASTQFFNAASNLKDKTYNAENCFNILGYYYKTKDKANFNKWYAEFTKWPTTDKRIPAYADVIRKEMEKVK
jgi:tetratricopeptide (TPR) repeat protein